MLQANFHSCNVRTLCSEKRCKAVARYKPLKRYTYFHSCNTATTATPRAHVRGPSESPCPSRVCACMTRKTGVAGVAALQEFEFACLFRFLALQHMRNALLQSRCSRCANANSQAGSTTCLPSPVQQAATIAAKMRIHERAKRIQGCAARKRARRVTVLQLILTSRAYSSASSCRNTLAGTE
jgi:hypothetical protein